MTKYGIHMILIMMEQIGEIQSMEESSEEVVVIKKKKQIKFKSPAPVKKPVRKQHQKQKRKQP